MNTDPPYVWRQEVVTADPDGKIGILNDYVLVRTAHFDPRGLLPDDDIAAEGIDVMRWWALSDSAAYSGPDLFSPRNLSSLLSDLIAGGVPRTPVPLGLRADSAPAWCHTGCMALHITGDTAADTLLTENPLALLVGMLLDQQVR